ncbi:MAG: hypothetical protein WCA92_00550 [Terriglobales bacterium]
MKSPLAFLILLAAVASAQDQPRVYLACASTACSWNSHRDPTTELTIQLTNDFQKQCSHATVIATGEKADYRVILNHIEHGFGCDNRIEVDNKEGDVLGTRAKGSLRDKIKTACDLILADWNKGNHSPAPESK